MDLLAAIKREERKLEKELGKLQQKLNGVKSAAKALGVTTVREVTQVKKRVMSAAAKAKISKATKARWAKFPAEKNKKAKARRTLRHKRSISTRWATENSEATILRINFTAQTVEYIFPLRRASVLRISSR